MNTSGKYEFMVAEEARNVRLDLFLSRQLDQVSRSYLQDLIQSGQVTRNGRPAKASSRLKPRDQVVVFLPEPEPIRIEPEAIPLDILFEDTDLLVVNKPQGLVVHPAPGHNHGTLVHALLYHCRDLAGIRGSLRPGIVHRLDKETSGLLVVAKTDMAMQGLIGQIKERRVRRHYLALVHGQLDPEAGRIEAPIGRSPRDRKKMAVVETGRPAVTWYHVLERYTGFCLVEARLETGRTHQIRVHLASKGHPVAGDPVYGPRHPAFDLRGQALHAWYLALEHPRTGAPLEFTAPLPAYFREVLEKLRAKAREPSPGNSGGEGEWVMVYAAANQLQAWVIAGKLEAGGIPVSLRFESAGSLYGLTTGPLAEVKIFVPRWAEEMARRIIAVENLGLHSPDQS
ncbi:MAG: RluA family pseudouridine synthase [Clostridia bacterium]|nr:MAG: RluA family pseudouridine synthase [Clostridia bacterium]